MNGGEVVAAADARGAEVDHEGVAGAGVKEVAEADDKDEPAHEGVFGDGGEDEVAAGHEAVDVMVGEPGLAFAALVSEGAAGLGEAFIVGDDHATFAGGDLFIGVEAEDASAAEGADHAFAGASAEAFAGIFDEDDLVFLGELEEGVHRRETFKKALVAVAAEKDGRRFGRIRIQRSPDASAASLRAFVHAHVLPGSTVHTDPWEGYRRLASYPHHVSKLGGQPKLESVLLPRVHRVSSLLKRWLLGTHQGAVCPAHLDDYMDEFTFRFNRRASRYRGKLFYRLLQQAVVTAPAPYYRLNQHIRPGPEHPHHKG